MDFIKKIVAVIAVVIVLGALLPVLFPLVEDANDSIGDMSGGAATDILKAGFPIALVVIGIAIAIGLVLYALRLFGVLGKIRE